MASLDGIRTHLGENDPRWKPSGGKRGGPASALPCITRARYRIFKRFIASRAVLWQIIPASEKVAWHGARAACSRSGEGGSLREQVHFHPMLPYFHRGLHTRARIRMRGTCRLRISRPTNSARVRFTKQRISAPSNLYYILRCAECLRN